jgi:hypothetical protein
MIRKFKFEAEIFESLNCLPMSARRKLDAVGIKLHLAQWEQLGRGERLMICHAPTDSEEEQSAPRTFIEEVAPARTGSPAKTLSDDTRRGPPIRPIARRRYWPTTRAWPVSNSTTRHGRLSTTTSVTP